MVVHGPKGLRAEGEIRGQFAHVIDVAPTVLQAAGLPEPKVVNGTKQIPMEGRSLLATFNDGKAKAPRTPQCFEIAGNRAIYHDGRFARTIHKAPWEPKPRRALEDDLWELYDVCNDFSLANDVPARRPKKLALLKASFMKESERYHVLPLDDRFLERTGAHRIGLPDLMGGRTSLTLAKGMTGMMEAVFINARNRPKTIAAEVEVPQGGGNGTILAQGGRVGGWSLYVKDGGPAKGGTGTLTVDGEKVAEGRIAVTRAGIFSADETADAGIDLGTPVVEAIGAEAKSRFAGRIPKVTVGVK